MLASRSGCSCAVVSPAGASTFTKSSSAAAPQLQTFLARRKRDGGTAACECETRRLLRLRRGCQYPIACRCAARPNASPCDMLTSRRGQVALMSTRRLVGVGPAGHLCCRSLSTARCGAFMWRHPPPSSCKREEVRSRAFELMHRTAQDRREPLRTAPHEHAEQTHRLTCTASRVLLQSLDGHDSIGSSIGSSSGASSSSVRLSAVRTERHRAARFRSAHETLLEESVHCPSVGRVWA